MALNCIVPYSTSDHRPKRSKYDAYKDKFEPILQGRYEFVKFLAQGSYGDVCKAKPINERVELIPDKYVAVKNVRDVFENKTEAKRLLRELKILRLLQHDQVVKIHDIIPPDDFMNFEALAVVFEFVQTDLSKVMNTEQFFTENHVRCILYQILVASKFMHSCNLAHRDLKPANILIDEKCSVKVCDYGLSRQIQKSEKLARHRRKMSNIAMPLERTLTSHVVTRWYRAPEIMMQEGYDTKVDIWAIGCIFAELLKMQKDNCPNTHAREPFFPGTSSSMTPRESDEYSEYENKDQLQIIFETIGRPEEDEISQIPDAYARDYLRSVRGSERTLRQQFPGASDDALDLLSKLLKFTANRRMNAAEALDHPFFIPIRMRKAEKSFPNLGLVDSEFDFEDIRLSEMKIREMICREVVYYNPHLKHKLEMFQLVPTSPPRSLRRIHSSRSTSPLPSPPDSMPRLHGGAASLQSNGVAVGVVGGLEPPASGVPASSSSGDSGHPDRDRDHLSSSGYAERPTGHGRSLSHGPVSSQSISPMNGVSSGSRKSDSGGGGGGATRASSNSLDAPASNNKYAGSTPHHVHAKQAGGERRSPPEKRSTLQRKRHSRRDSAGSTSSSSSTGDSWVRNKYERGRPSLSPIPADEEFSEFSDQDGSGGYTVRTPTDNTNSDRRNGYSPPRNSSSSAYPSAQAQTTQTGGGSAQKPQMRRARTMRVSRSTNASPAPEDLDRSSFSRQCSVAQRKSSDRSDRSNNWSPEKETERERNGRSSGSSARDRLERLGSLTSRVTGLMPTKQGRSLPKDSHYGSSSSSRRRNGDRGESPSNRSYHEEGESSLRGLERMLSAPSSRQNSPPNGSRTLPRVASVKIPGREKRTKERTTTVLVDRDLASERARSFRASLRRERRKKKAAQASAKSLSPARNGDAKYHRTMPRIQSNNSPDRSLHSGSVTVASIAASGRSTSRSPLREKRAMPRSQLQRSQTTRRAKSSSHLVDANGFAIPAPTHRKRPSMRSIFPSGGRTSTSSKEGSPTSDGSRSSSPRRARRSPQHAQSSSALLSPPQDATHVRRSSDLQHRNSIVKRSSKFLLASLTRRKTHTGTALSSATANARAAADES